MTPNFVNRSERVDGMCDNLKPTSSRMERMAYGVQQT